MIPKKIHYCWFGGNEMPKSAKKCIKSWKKYFPDFEIIEWNESNFNIDYNSYTREAYDNKKYAFLTDVARLLIIYEHGGIYFDVDVEVIETFNDILNNKAFFGLEKKNQVATGLGFGAEKSNWIVKLLLDDYNDKHLKKENGELDLTPCTVLNTNVFKNAGFILNNEIEIIKDVCVYPADYFNPLENSTGKLYITPNTKSIHWYLKSWVPFNQKIISKITQPFHRIFGEDCFKWLKRGGK